MIFLYNSKSPFYYRTFSFEYYLGLKEKIITCYIFNMNYLAKYRNMDITSNQEVFMARICWYCLLAIIGVGIAAFTIYKKRDTAKLSTYLVFLLFATCITWIGEFIVLGLFNSYAYKTGIYTSPWAQNVLGHLILNSTFYPGTAILVAAYSLGYGWISLITSIYLLLEYLFLKLGVYEHHWWKYYMTDKMWGKAVLYPVIP